MPSKIRHSAIIFQKTFAYSLSLGVGGIRRPSFARRAGHAHTASHKPRRGDSLRSNIGVRSAVLIVSL